MQTFLVIRKKTFFFERTFAFCERTNNTVFCSNINTPSQCPSIAFNSNPFSFKSSCNWVVVSVNAQNMLVFLFSAFHKIWLFYCDKNNGEKLTNDFADMCISWRRHWPKLQLVKYFSLFTRMNIFWKQKKRMNSECIETSLCLCSCYNSKLLDSLSILKRSFASRPKEKKNLFHGFIERLLFS